MRTRRLRNSVEILLCNLRTSLMSLILHQCALTIHHISRISTPSSFRCLVYQSTFCWFLCISFVKLFRLLLSNSINSLLTKLCSDAQHLFLVVLFPYLNYIETANLCFSYTIVLFLTCRHDLLFSVFCDLDCIIVYVLAFPLVNTSPLEV